jgi:hypothetical protein
MESPPQSLNTSATDDRPAVDPKDRMKRKPRTMVSTSTEMRIVSGFL